MLMISVETRATKLVASQPYFVLHKPQLVVAEKTVGMASLATHIGFHKCLWVQNVQIGSNMLNITCHRKSSSRQRRATNKYTNDASHRISLPAPCGSAYDNFNLSDLSDLLIIRLHPIAFIYLGLSNSSYPMTSTYISTFSFPSTPA